MSKLVDFPSSLPTIAIPQDIDASFVANSFAPKLEQLGESHFVKDAVWRDIFALTGTLRTFYGSASILAAWKETSERAKVGAFVLDSARVNRTPFGAHWIESLFSFDSGGTPQTSCTAILTLVMDVGRNWRIWTMRTILQQLKGQPSVDCLTRADALRLSNGLEEKSHFDCVVIGAGQAGLSVAGRLKALRVSYVVIDKYKEVGDNWKNRYDSAKLHTTREYAHLPFERTFTPDYPDWLGKDDLARGYKGWVSRFDINIWTDTSILSGAWDEVSKLWTLKISRAGDAEQSVTASFVVIAGGGLGQVPLIPNYLNADAFKGVVIHSKNYINASRWTGKHGVVVGTANTAHDVAEDMLISKLASVTMIQRSSTYVVPVEYYQKIADMSYNTTIPTEVADRATQTQPVAILDLLSSAGLGGMIRANSARFDALENAGFKLDRFASLTDCLYNRGGGHYMDVGASEKISRGLIKMKTDALPTEYTEDGLNFSNGSHLKADVIVFATGFKGNMQYLVEEIFGPNIAEQMGPYWGLDKQGELRGAYKSCGHPAMWYHGGTQGQARYYSRFIALQIKARLLGTPLPLYE